MLSGIEENIIGQLWDTLRRFTSRALFGPLRRSPG